MAVLIPDEKWLVLINKIIFWPVQKATGYHPGPVVPPTTDGASFIVTSQQNMQPAVSEIRLKKLNHIFLAFKPCFEQLCINMEWNHGLTNRSNCFWQPRNKKATNKAHFSWAFLKVNGFTSNLLDITFICPQRNSNFNTIAFLYDLHQTLRTPKHLTAL